MTATIGDVTEAELQRMRDVLVNDYQRISNDDARRLLATIERLRTTNLVDAAISWANCDCDICAGAACTKAMKLYTTIKTLK